MRYEHTQHGKVHIVLGLVSAVLLIAGALTRPEFISVVLFSAGGVLFIMAFCFAHLTVEDGGDDLLIRYGPFPLLRKRIPYRSITGVEVGQSSWLDGWGIHYVPGRGWTYNLWGWSCVVLRCGSRTIRVGTDEPEGLAEFLRERIGRARAGS